MSAPDSGAAYIADRITRDGRGGYPVEPGRYRLVAARACPCASRVIVVRGLLGLEAPLPMALCGPTHDDRSWTFDLDPGGRDPVLGIERLQETYLRRYPDYAGGVTVPAIVDVTTGQIVTNDYAQILVDLCVEWRAHHREGAPDLYPERLRTEIDALGQVLHADNTHGVYECGFATSQQAYDAPFRRLFDRLTWLEEHLAERRYLIGDSITLVDIALFTTLVRFDAVYHGHFKCNLQKLTEMPVLWAYARDLFQTPGFGDTVDFKQIKLHYYRVHRRLNPGGILPAGPDLSGWAVPHHRGQLGAARSNVDGRICRGGAP